MIEEHSQQIRINSGTLLKWPLLGQGYKKIKVDKLVVEKFPAVANFHEVIKSCRDRKSSCLPLFYLLYLSVPS